MSLINDALKRARDADRRRAAAPPDLSLQPVDTPHRGNTASRWLVLVLVLLALSLSLWSFSRWARTAPPPDRLAGTPRTSSPPPSPPASESRPAPEPAASAPESVPEPPFSIPTNTPPADPLPSAVPDSMPEAETPQTAEIATNIVTSSPAAQEPELKLHSIIFRFRNPSVVINGQMLHEGDTIADAQILDIERHRVTLRRHDSNIVLTLPPY